MNLFILLLLTFYTVPRTSSENDTPSDTFDNDDVAMSEEEQDARDEESLSRNIQVSRYLGLGYNIFRGNRFLTLVDPGLKRNSFKPIRIVKVTSKSNSTCPEFAHCLSSHEPEIPDRYVFVRTLEDYQLGILDELHINGRTTTNTSSAFGLLDKSVSDIGQHLAKGQYFVDRIRVSISQEAELEYRHPLSLHRAFVIAVCELPEAYHYDEYAAFLTEFGTHVVVKVREAVIAINRTFIDKQAIHQAAQEAGVNITQLRGHNVGFNPSDVSKSLLERALELMVSQGTAENKTVCFTSAAEVPMVTGLREISYFVKPERIRASGRLSESCLLLTEQTTEDLVVRKVENIRKNLEVALVAFANKTVAENLVIQQKPSFILWGSSVSEKLNGAGNATDVKIYVQSTTTPEPLEIVVVANPVPIVKVVPESSKSIQEVTNVCATALSFLGLSYDVFRGDLYSLARDPGLHSPPPVITRSACPANSTTCDDRAAQCSMVSPYTSMKENSYVWSVGDFTKQLSKKYSMLHLLPKSAVGSLFANSASVKTVRSLVSDGQTFIDSIIANTSAEAHASYRAMDQLDPNFVHALCELPTLYNRTAYTHILQEFGTHVVTKVRVGNLTVKRTIIPQVTVLNEAIKKHRDLERDTVQLQLTTSQLQAATDLVVKKSRTLKRGGIQPISVVSKTDTPISWTLRELSYFITKERVKSAKLGDMCQHLTDDIEAVANVKTGLCRALEHYAEDMAVENSVISRTASPPQRPEPDRTKVWPTGTYGLLEVSSGCPNGQWHHGQRFHDSEDSNNRNAWAQPLEWLTTSKLAKEGIRLNFCVKTESDPEVEPEWPRGSYCLFKKSICPKGFQTSYVTHDDEDDRNGNNASGVLPDGFYTQDTRYYFCCRSDGAAEVPIPLPTEKSFFLLQNGNTCQLVQGVRATPLWLFTDCEDKRYGGCRVSNSGGSYPGVVTAEGDWQWNFCYYEPVRLLRPFSLLPHDSFLYSLFDYS